MMVLMYMKAHVDEQTSVSKGAIQLHNPQNNMILRILLPQNLLL